MSPGNMSRVRYACRKIEALIITTYQGDSWEDVKYETDQKTASISEYHAWDNPGKEEDCQGYRHSDY